MSPATVVINLMESNKSLLHAWISHQVAGQQVFPPAPNVFVVNNADGPLGLSTNAGRPRAGA